MKQRTLLLTFTALASFALFGCNSTSNTGGNNNGGVPAELQAVINNDDAGNPAAAGVYGGTDGQDELGLDAAALSGPGSSSPIPDTLKFRWFRKPTSFSDNHSRSGTADSVFVVSHREVTGLLNGILKVRHNQGHSAQADSVLYQKPFGVSWNRSAIYKKMTLPTADGEDGTLWVLKSLTLAKATQTSPNLPTPQIVSVTVSGQDSSGAPLSVTFTDPDQMYDPLSLPKFPLGDSISVKVVTDGTDASQVAFIHFDNNASDHSQCWRRPLAFNSADNAFEGAFKVREGWGGRHHNNLRARSAVWVDIMTRPTLYDTDPGIYAASAWGVPYRLFRSLGNHHLASNLQ